MRSYIESNCPLILKGINDLINMGDVTKYDTPIYIIERLMNLNNYSIPSANSDLNNELDKFEEFIR